jgi:hypothetical protein
LWLCSLFIFVLLLWVFSLFCFIILAKEKTRQNPISIPGLVEWCFSLFYVDEKNAKDWEYSSVVECLPVMPESLDLITSKMHIHVHAPQTHMRLNIRNLFLLIVLQARLSNYIWWELLLSYNMAHGMCKRVHMREKTREWPESLFCNNTVSQELYFCYNCINPW